jgi:4'-phosphopantetheinyl transferase
METWWLEQSTAEIPAASDWLSPAEKLRLDAFRFAKRRDDWRLGRWTAKRAVAAYLKVPCDPTTLARFEIRPAASGAPEMFCNDQPAEVSISITHRDGVAACAVARPEIAIGCDLELIEPRNDAFLADYFTAAEQGFVKAGSTAERVIFPTLLWSAKESALKALKVGLRVDTRCVEVSLGEKSLEEPLDWLPLTVIYTNGHSLHGWWLANGELVRTIVTIPSTPAPSFVSAIPREAR